jgi:hypothetical protein
VHVRREDGGRWLRRATTPDEPLVTRLGTSSSSPERASVRRLPCRRPRGLPRAPRRGGPAKPCPAGGGRADLRPARPPDGAPPGSLQTSGSPTPCARRFAGGTSSTTRPAAATSSTAAWTRRPRPPCVTSAASTPITPPPPDPSSGGGEELGGEATLAPQGEGGDCGSSRPPLWERGDGTNGRSRRLSAPLRPGATAVRRGISQPPLSQGSATSKEGWAARALMPSARRGRICRTGRVVASWF